MKNLLVWLVLAAPAFSQILPMEGSRGYIFYGLVYLPDGNTARNATVRISSASGLERRILTDSNGRYEMRDVPQGRYAITAYYPDEPDMVCQFAEIDTSRSASNKIQVALYLRYRVDKTLETAKTPVISARTAAQQIPKQALKAIEQGQKFGSEGKLDRAEASFTKALESYPDYPQALAERGNVRIAAGRLAEASADFALALKADPQFGPALRGSGVCKFQQGQYVEAVADLEKASAVEPNLAKNFVYLGLAHMALDQREPARAAFRRALSLDPKESVRSHLHLANICIRENRPGEALNELDAYLAAVPDPPDKEKLLAMRSQLRAAVGK